jgi:hypothetical protein
MKRPVNFKALARTVGVVAAVVVSSKQGNVRDLAEPARHTGRQYHRNGNG